MAQPSGFSDLPKAAMICKIMHEIQIQLFRFYFCIQNIYTKVCITSYANFITKVSSIYVYGVSSKGCELEEVSATKSQVASAKKMLS